MDIIINDFSLDGQFSDDEQFIESLYENTLPMLTDLEKVDATILRSYYSYEAKVTKDKTLNDLLITRGNPEITKLKGQLQKMFFEEPYWEDNLQSIEEIYECEFTEKKNQFCLAEALERNISVLSFEHEKFNKSPIEISKNTECNYIKNLFNKEIMLQILREQRIITHLQFIILKYSMGESFGLKKGSNYFSELVESASLSLDDQSYIISDMDKLINFFLKGENPGDLSKTIEGRLKEFRTSLTNNRQIRFFYFERNNKIIFMNGFLKKTQKTPNNQIDRAKRIMSEH
ncbi:hypothetical protein FDB34_02050 [Clostridium botulinum]|nr:hypothetical protein [Clostridium botulinum]